MGVLEVIDVVKSSNSTENELRLTVSGIGILFLYSDTSNKMADII